MEKVQIMGLEKVTSQEIVSLIGLSKTIIA
jgi:hypothetical protein